jgi:hypothetical protein
LGATTTKSSTPLEVQSQAGNAIKVNGSWYVLGAQITTSLKVACIANDPLDLDVVVSTTATLTTVDVCSYSGAQRPVFRQDLKVSWLRLMARPIWHLTNVLVLLRFYSIASFFERMAYNKKSKKNLSVR